jgi:F420-0:gamma-glutamyl ligase
VREDTESASVVDWSETSDSGVVGVASTVVEAISGVLASSAKIARGERAREKSWNRARMRTERRLGFSINNWLD